MIYVTGDTHGELAEFLERLALLSLTEKDTVIVCGDFGFTWGDPAHNAMLKELSKLPFTIAFADGNHENFEFLYAHPVEEWQGGRVHRLERNIVHLMRGNVFEIEGRKFFAFGGAYSVDKMWRRNRISWWEEEIPCAEEYNTAADNLERVGYRVDFVLTHQIPRRFIHALNFAPNDPEMELTGYLDWLYDNLAFEKWFAGHWHEKLTFDDGKMNILYENVQTIPPL